MIAEPTICQFCRCFPCECKPLFAAARGSENPLPDYLDGIYSGWGRWEDYEQGTYRKKPCMVITKLNHKIGPCWPNAGKFVAFDNSREVPEREVVAVCYATAAEDSRNR